jgi:hypothetical protein
MDKKALIKALRDTVQSASNTVASGVSAPVDLIAAGLRKVGMPIPQAPVGGSQWMENMGLTVPVEDGIPKLAGETLGMIVPMAATAKAPQIAAAANRGLENLAAPRTLNTPGFRGQRGAIVWHGSPYKFDVFDADKAGRGVDGTWFSDSKSYATWIASHAKDKNGFLYKVNADIKNPYIYDIMDEAKKYADAIRVDPPGSALEAQELLSGGMGWDRLVADILHEIKHKGHDALEIRNFNDAFHSNPNEVTTAFVVPNNKTDILKILERNGQPMGLMGVK